MPYLPTAQSWLENSTLLLSARPTTTRITTKYTVLPQSRSAGKKSKPNPSAHTPSTEPTSTPSQQPAKAVLVLKTYDPVSGVCLKYSTEKAWEVGRLITALGTCGRVMAALPERTEREEEPKGDREVKVEVGGAEKEGTRGKGGGGGKKKKGKR